MQLFIPSNLTIFVLLQSYIQKESRSTGWNGLRITQALNVLLKLLNTPMKR